MYDNLSTTPGLELMSHGILILIFSMMVSKYLFCPLQYSPGLLGLPSKLGKQFYHRISLFLWVFIIGYITTVILREQNLSASWVELSRTLFITVMSAIAGWICLLWYRSLITRSSFRGIFVVLPIVVMMSLAALVITEWLGYHRLAVFVITGLCLSIVFTLALVV